MDYTRAILFCKTNNFNHDQTDELISILKDVTFQTIETCNDKFTKLLEKKSNAIN